ncbi:MAG: LytTR family DNA-binding domain-containing protein [Clostridiaceae bacterium]
MKIFIEEKNEVDEIEVHIICKQKNKKVISLLKRIKEDKKIIGKSLRGTAQILTLTQVMYFESVDKRTYSYTESEVYEIDYKLYELESQLSESKFLRISKSVILNFSYVTEIKPEEGRRLKVRLQNGEWLMVSRMYVKEINCILGMK